MPLFKLIFLCWLTVVCQPLLALQNNDILPPQEAFKVTGTALSNNQIQIDWQIAEGYLVYRNSLAFESKTDYVQLNVDSLPAAKTKHDDIQGDIDHYDSSFKVKLDLLDVMDAQAVEVLVKFQGCSVQGVCYPPQKQTLAITLPPPLQQSPPPIAQAANPFAQLLQKIPAVVSASGQGELLPAEQAFQFFATVKDAGTLQLNWSIAEGYYLYREKIQLQLSDAQGVQLGRYDIPRGTPMVDESFGKVEVFHQGLDITVPLQRNLATTQTITLKAAYQGCADRGVCYPPMTSEVRLTLPVGNSAKPQAETTDTAPLSEQDQITSGLHKDSLWASLLSFFGFGFLLSLTPCIFPMIPILSGIIVGHHHQHSTARAFLLSLSYVVASALMYTLFGVLAALFGNNLQATLQQPWIIALFSSVFVVLSLSMFGLYNLDLPNAIKLRLHNSSVRHQDGSLWGAGIMGALSSLLVGPCVAAPLAGALIYIGQTGDVLLGGGALFAMGMGMGVPLLLLGASAGRLLPKAGSWLNATKAVFGVLMLAVAVWMLSRILPAEVTMLLWSMLLIVPAIYLNALDPLPATSSGWAKLWKGVGLIMLAYGLLLLVGAGMGNINPLKPLQGLTGKGDKPQAHGLAFEKIASVASLRARIALAAANHQPVMLDFYADWCVSCKEMEAYTFTDAKVQQALAGFVLLQADVTQNNDADKALLAEFALVGPPGVLFFNTQQQEIKSLRVIGYQNAEAFLKTLQQTRL